MAGALDMQLSDKFWKKVDQVIEMIGTETGLPMLALNKKGRIVRATDKNKIGNIHPCAEKIQRMEAEGFAVTPEEAAKVPQVKEGFVCPIIIDDHPMAALAINGNLELAKPITKIASKMVEDWAQSRKDQKSIEVGNQQSTVEATGMLSEEKYYKAFNNSPVWVVLSSMETGRYIEVNETFLRTMGYTREEVIGRTSLEISTWENPNDRTAILNRIQEKGHARNYEVIRLSRSGKKLTMLFSADVIEVSGEACLLSVSQDITARKQAEEQAKKLGTALLQSQKMEAIGTLAGGIAHDFNNILTAVIGYAEISLKKTPKETRIHNNLEQILTAGLRARDLVRQILIFSRQTEIELKPIQIEPLVHESLKLLRSTLPSTIDIKQHIDTDLDYVMADPIQIQQIVMNLCANAAQAMEPNGGRLTLRLSAVTLTQQDLHLHPRLKPGAYMKLSVEDTGKGMHEEIMDKIYQPYFTTKEQGEGTGLGLSVVHGIVQSYGGAINVYSEAGHGTTFNIYIPAAERPALNTGPDHAELFTGSERILFVDDEPALVDLGREILEMLGYDVTACHGALAAHDIFTKAPHAIDLVISDLTMPGMTGDKLAIQLLQKRPDLPIILCTGFGNKITPDIAAKIGVKRIVAKPLVVEELAKVVRTVLDENG